MKNELMIIFTVLLLGSNLYSMEDGQNNKKRLRSDDGGEIASHKKAKITENELLQLHAACKVGAMEKIKKLLTDGVKIDTKDKNGCTPLHIAAQKGYVNIVQILLDHSAEINAVNDFHETPLHDAARKGKFEVVKLLLAKGVKKEVCNENGETPLHLAAMNNHVDVVEILISAGANKETRDNFEQTPYLVAAYYNCCDAMKVLTDSGVDICAIDNDRKLAMDYAMDPDVNYFIDSESDLTASFIDESLAKLKGEVPAEKIKCPICFEDRWGVEILDCGHELCITCLKNLKNQHKEISEMNSVERGSDPTFLNIYNNGLKCPLCRAEIKI